MAAKLNKRSIESSVQENLLSLYLRLNGYFVTGFIVHSPDCGRNQTEIDILAVRFPFNSEPERQVMPSKFLQVSDERIDFLICEVKSKGKKLQFNEALRNSDDALRSVLRWVGLFSKDEVEEIVPLIKREMLPKEKQEFVIPTVDIDGHRLARIRCVLCCPEQETRHDTQPWFLHGRELLNYIFNCLCPEIPRCTCSTRYDFGLWGQQLEPIVSYFKKCCKGNPGTIKDLYDYIENLHE